MDPLLLCELVPASPSSRCRTILHLDGDCMELSVLFRDSPKLKALSRNKGSITVRPHLGKRRVTCSSPYARKHRIYPGLSEDGARHRCPGILVFPEYREPMVEFCRQIRQDLESLVPVVEQEGTDGFFLDLTGCEKLFRGDLWKWSYGLLSHLRKKWKVSFSGGLASNKTTARLATRSAKWGNITRVLPGFEGDFLSVCPLHRIPGMGKNLIKRLQDIGIHRAGEFAALDQSSAFELFGASGLALWKRCHGLCDDPVCPKRPVSQWSISRELHGLPDQQRFLSILCSLVEELLSSMRGTSYLPSCLGLQITYSDSLSLRTSLRLPLPSRDLREWVRVTHAHWNSMTLRRVQVSRITLNFQQTETNSVTEDFFHLAQEHKSMELFKAVDRIQDRYGYPALRSASSCPGKRCS